MKREATTVQVAAPEASALGGLDRDATIATALLADLQRLWMRAKLRQA